MQLRCLNRVVRVATRTISAAAGTAKPADAGSTDPPPLRELDPWEKAAIHILIGSGLLLTIGTLVLFVLVHKGGGGFVSKSVTTTGTGSSAKVAETDYGDTVAIFALTTGAAFLLVGCLYGRLRDLTLGALKLDVSEQ